MILHSQFNLLHTADCTPVILLSFFFLIPYINTTALAVLLDSCIFLHAAIYIKQINIIDYVFTLHGTHS